MVTTKTKHEKARQEVCFAFLQSPKFIEFDMGVKGDEISCKMSAGLIFFYVHICIPWPHRGVEDSKRNFTLKRG